MSDLLNIFGALSQLDYKPSYDNEKCVKSISPKAKCRDCYDVCHAEAISLKKSGIVISDACNFCYECVSYCPTNALVDTGRTFLKHGTKTYLLCKKQEVEGDPDLFVDCLNYINRKILLNMYTYGIRTIHTNLDKCETCPRYNNMLGELDRANEILQILGKDPMTLVDTSNEDILQEISSLKVKKETEEIGRRDFFKGLFKETLKKAYQVSPPSSRDQFWDLEVDIVNRWTKDSTRLALYTIDHDKDKCIDCKSCVTLCPQKVWIIEDGARIERTHLCHGCKLCQDICPKGALEVKDHIHFIE